MELIRVMLVDDEPMALENVADIIDWHEHGFEVVIQTTDPRKAWEWFEKKRPKIVISDISMPHIDGLELGKRILETEPGTRIVFLTAYRDFDYVRQALELKAAHYVLKHEISQNRLLNQLLAIKQSLTDEQAIWKNVKKQLLLDALHGKWLMEPHDSNSPAAREVNQVLQGSSALFYFEVGSTYLLNGGKRCGQIQQPEQVWQLVTSMMQDEGESRWFEAVEDGKEGYALILQLPNPQSTLFCWNEAYKVAGFIQKAISTIEEVPVSLSIALCTSSQTIPTAYQALKATYDYSMFFPARTLFSLEQAQSGLRNEPLEANQKAVQAIKNEIELCNRDAAVEVLEKLFTVSLIGHKHIRAFRQVIKELGKYIQDRFAIDPALPLGTDASTILQSFIREINDQLAKDELTANAHSRWVVKAVEYVKHHYGESDLSVESVAANINISSIHLRKTFKKEMNKTLSDFITEFRIERAKELLKKDELKIYEISTLVGYQTSQYFSQVFKKMTGTYPSEYKDRVGG